LLTAYYAAQLTFAKILPNGNIIKDQELHSGNLFAQKIFFIPAKQPVNSGWA